MVLLVESPALAWGPGTHLTLASDLLSNLWLLPAAVAGLLSRHRAHYRYGTVAADVVFAKKLGRVKQICHNWNTAFSILERAGRDEDRAFAFGYLSHLAADTVAHNKFLPRQMAVSRSTINFGHLYWELRADAGIESAQWRQLRVLLGRHYPGASELLEQHLHSTLLSYPTNQLLFTRMNLLVSMRSWRRSVQLWGRVSRWPLPADLLAGYRAESLERIADVLSRGAHSRVLAEDPNGNEALHSARARRKQLKRLKRRRMPFDHIVHHATHSLAPQPGGLVNRARPA